MPRETRLFDEGWEFLKISLDDAGAPAAEAPPAGGPWKRIDIPHDWLIHDVSKLYESSIGWYRKGFEAERVDGERILLRFEGVYMDSAVYVNGRKAGEWKHGYTSFEIDVTDHLRSGANEVLVRVVYRSPNSRWYSGAGIYRHVWLKRLPARRIPTDGVYISTADEGPSWRVDISTEICLDRDSSGPLRLRQTVLEAGGRVLGSAETLIPGPRGRISVDQSICVENPARWDIDSPVLYRLRTELFDGDESIDAVEDGFGFRSIEFHPDKGFILNGRRLKLQGVCQHHDLGCLGAAFNKAALRRQMLTLKEMGANAIRTAHNPPAPEFMELADELGILVESELYDIWEEPKTPYDFARFFGEWHERDMAAWIRRDRNHPSLIMWSLGNEIHDCHAGKRGLEITAELLALAKKHDPRGNAAPTLSSNYMPWEGAQKCADLVKLAGYNYGPQYYLIHHRQHPDWIIYGSETSSIVQSRGIYHFPLSKHILDDDDQQCSALGNSPLSYGAKSLEECLEAEREADFSAGQFIWSGTDYLGEPTPYHTKNSYYGQIDTAGFPKDSFYVYQAAWTDFRKKPMVHVFPYWCFNPGQLIDIRVCSNAPEVELFLNGSSLGRKKLLSGGGVSCIADYQAAYVPGELRALAYDDTGRVVAENTRSSFGDAAAILVKADKRSLMADGRDLAFIEISALDEVGRPVENATNRVSVEVRGAGRLVGLDNGDSTDYEQYKGTSRRLFSGRLLAVVASRLEAGRIDVEVSSPGLPKVSLVMEALACPRPAGVSAEMENPRSRDIDELPVRAIQIIVSGGTRMGPERKELSARAEILPVGASYSDLEWRATDDAGIDSVIAKVEAAGTEARVRALADGRFRLRCAARNGRASISLISQLEFEVEGLGQAFLDPYGFVAGGLYSLSNGELGPGNERGVATRREGESHVGFQNVDFGPFGSDEVTVPIFELNNEPLVFRVWEGMPGEDGSEMLADAVYHKKSIWGVYQEQTFKLSRRLRGVTTVCFTTDHKAHIKGFRFTRQRKAFSRLWAAENDRIYGDDFKVVGRAVFGIGNNVTLEFADMDFGPTGTTRVRIRGRSLAPKTTIHLRFSGPEGESKQIAEFEGSPGPVEMEFPLERVTGMRRLSFIFLPGSAFDFECFEFLEG